MADQVIQNAVYPYPATTGGTTYTLSMNTANTGQSVLQTIAPAMPTRPQGKPIPQPVPLGIWISENTKGAKSRKVIEVVCGSHVVCEGKRHSIIKWKNLGRYIEVDPPWDSEEFWAEFWAKRP